MIRVNDIYYCFEHGMFKIIAIDKSIFIHKTFTIEFLEKDHKKIMIVNDNFVKHSKKIDLKGYKIVNSYALNKFDLPLKILKDSITDLESIVKLFED